MSEQDDITLKAGALPRAVAPPRDLWPDIAARLTEAPGRAHAEVAGESQADGFPWRSLALAAGLLLAVTVGFWLGRTPDDLSDAPVIAGAPDDTKATPDHLRPAGWVPGADLHQTRLHLVREIEQRLAKLNPATRDVVLDNLAVINEAMDEIDAALEATPESDLDARLLMAMYGDQLVLLNTMNNALYPATPEVLL